MNAGTEIMNISLTQKEWTDLIQRCLVWLSENNPTDPALFKAERQVIPASFTDSSASQFCYAFKGVFLPSGNLDGIVWKPSQGAKPTGRGLMKRYFYYKKDQVKINRQVIWLSNQENWCFVDYRYNFKGKIRLVDASVPPGFNFEKLINLACTSCPSPLPFSLSTKDTLPKPSMTRKRKELDLFSEFSEESLVPLSDSIRNFCGDLETLDCLDIQTDDLETFGGFGLSNTGTDSLFNDSLQFDSIGEPRALSPFSSPISSTFSPPENSWVDKLFDDASSSKKRKPNYAPSFFSTPFEYFFDMISNMLVVQIIFKRRFFKKYETTTKDYDQILEKVKQDVIGTVDLNEFPGNLVRHFLGWLSESFCQTRREDLPTIYCLVCGMGNGQHDQAVHRRFFSNLDLEFVEGLRERGKSVPELVRFFITYLLKNPGSCASIEFTISRFLHCPFCSEQNGKHSAQEHQVWKNIFKIDPREHSTAMAPEPKNNITEKAKATFGWLMGYVPIYIPPFLLSFHYVRYVQNFLDCLVALWQRIRLI